jgi:regulator of RNase E activity RraA
MDMKQTDFHSLNAKQRSALAKIPTSLLSDGLDRLSGVVGLHRYGPLGRFVGSAVTVKARRINVPVSVGGQIVKPGDVLVGDEDRIVVFDPSQASRLIEFARRKAAQEQEVPNEIEGGGHPQSWIPVDALNVAIGKTESSQ